MRVADEQSLLTVSGLVAKLVRIARCSPRLPDGVAIAFQLNGTDGGTWTLVRTRGDVELRGGSPERVDCRFALSVVDFAAWLQGRLDPVSAFVERRVELEGDVGLLLRMQSAN